jgi:hypothetical protein
MTQPAAVPRHILPVLVAAQFAGTSLWVGFEQGQVLRKQQQCPLATRQLIFPADQNETHDLYPITVFK